MTEVLPLYCVIVPLPLGSGAKAPNESLSCLPMVDLDRRGSEPAPQDRETIKCPWKGDVVSLQRARGRKQRRRPIPAGMIAVVHGASSVPHGPHGTLHNASSTESL